MDTTRKNTYAAPRLIEVGTLVSKTLGALQVDDEAEGFRNPTAL